METTNETKRDLSLLDNIEQQPDVTQADLAVQLGMAIGTVNWHLKRLISKGYVKVMRAERRKLRYIITPEGLALRARLTLDYINTSFHLYRLVRERMTAALGEVRAKGYGQVRLLGDGGARAGGLPPDPDARNQTPPRNAAEGRHKAWPFGNAKRRWPG